MAAKAPIFFSERVPVLVALDVGSHFDKYI
jgi:hypothetical protein